MSTLKVTNIQHPSASSPGLSLDTSGLCYQLGTRNVLINGNPMINQRGYVSGTATTGANEYTVDRWRVVTTGESITWTDSNNVRTVTAPAGGVEQVVEGLNLLSGTYTLSWTGTATATVDGNPVTNGGQVTLTGGTNATVRFINGTFSLAQLERGSVVTPFEHRIYSDELAKCQRYYYRINSEDSSSYLAHGQTYNTQTLIGFVRFPVTMRTAPTALEQSGTSTDYRITANGNTLGCNAVPTFAAGTTATNASFNASIGTTSLAAGGSGFLTANTGANGFLGWSAEL